MNRELLGDRTNDTTKTIAGRTVNGGAAGNFQWKIEERLGPGNTILLDDEAPFGATAKR